MCSRLSLAVMLAVALIGRSMAGAPPVYDMVVGDEHDYAVRPGDNVWSVTGQFTMNVHHFYRLNALDDPDHLKPGMILRVSDRHIVPRRGGDGIFINLADRRLYWFEHNQLKASFPVGIGRIGWATPAGRYRIVARRKDPVWHVPPAIQDDMRASGQEVLTDVAPGPENPLGKYWIQLSANGIGLHGTNSPGSVGKYATHGCMRLRTEHIEELFRAAPNGTPVEIMWEPFKLARDAEGAVLLEVHTDVYRRRQPDLVEVTAAVAAAGLQEEVDWDRVTDVITRAWGTPEDVSRHDTPASTVTAHDATLVPIAPE